MRYFLAMISACLPIHASRGDSPLAPPPDHGDCFAQTACQGAPLATGLITRDECFYGAPYGASWKSQKTSDCTDH